MTRRLLLLAVLLGAATSLPACDRLYYKTMKKFGMEKRDIPVLQPLRDRVLFLKHNLNASAIGALDKELLSLRTNVDALVADLESSIAEAETFIAQMDAAAKAEK